MRQHRIIYLNIIETIFSTTTMIYLTDFVGVFPKAVFVVVLNMEIINKGSTVLQITLSSKACYRVNVLCLSKSVILPKTKLVTTIHHFYMSSVTLHSGIRMAEV